MSDEILKQILEEMKSMNQKMDRMETRLESAEATVQDTRGQMNSRFDTLETKLAHVENDVTTIKATVDHMAAETPEDVMGMLKQINSKLEEKDSDVQALNKRLFRTESVVERLSKQ
jgi:chromosome segregation ATPase